MTTFSERASTPVATTAPIGIFDSGIGGLSVLRHIQARLPHENVLYFADSGFAPYGGKPEQFIVTRSLAITDFLLQHGAKAIVVACNTATAAAIKALRACHPRLPIVGVEPGLKPAAALSKNNTIGVLATERTLASSKFRQLSERIAADSGVRVLTQACTGLADQIEKGELQSAATAELVQRYAAPLIAQGADTLVLGCTHYPFVLPLFQDAICDAGSGPITIIDTGRPIALHLASLLKDHDLLNASSSPGLLLTFTTGSEIALRDALKKLLDLQPSTAKVTIN
ncbi:glutamate racemase [Herminiimonas sp. CN]|uniref:glutamate racemase n=1 Tax=Herminiimonas sp. CN TaxID=1349818 RepID=UPI000473607C|nr:glutamate racemase [Herminiimonas sp. CN]